MNTNIISDMNISSSKCCDLLGPIISTYNISIHISNFCNNIMLMNWIKLKLNA